MLSPNKDIALQVEQHEGSDQNHHLGCVKVLIMCTVNKFLHQK